jgi:hypothetical protein
VVVVVVDLCGRISKKTSNRLKDLSPKSPHIYRGSFDLRLKATTLSVLNRQIVSCLIGAAVAASLSEAGVKAEVARAFNGTIARLVKLTPSRNERV